MLKTNYLIKTAGCLCLIAASAVGLHAGERNFLFASNQIGGPILGAPVYFGQTDSTLGFVQGDPAEGPVITEPVPDAAMMPSDAGMGAVPLYHNVCYKDVCRMSPCAVPKIVAVRDPCWKKDRCNKCEVAPCVYVQICVPNCGCERVRCSRDGKHVVYDYGKYSVSVTARNGKVFVNYDKGLL